jgi:hypothetical protein
MFYKYIFGLIIGWPALSMNNFKTCMSMPEYKIKCVQIRSLITMQGTEESDQKMNSWVNIYYRGDLIILEYPFMFDSSFSDWEQTETKLLLHEERTAYFVFHKDSSAGLKYNQYREGVSEQVGPLLLSWGIGNTGLDSFNTQKPDSSFLNKKSGTLKEIFRHYGTKGGLDNFTLSLFYSKELNDITASFSPLLDKAKNKKLVKIQIVYDEAYSEDLHKIVPQRMIQKEMVKYQPKDLDLINAFFDRYEKEVKR